MENELQAQPPAQTPVPTMQLMHGLNTQTGFIIGFGARGQQSEQVELAATIVYRDISLAVKELEAALAAARTAELHVSTQLAYDAGYRAAGESALALAAAGTQEAVPESTIEAVVQDDAIAPSPSLN